VRIRITETFTETDTDERKRNAGNQARGRRRIEGEQLTEATSAAENVAALALVAGRVVSFVDRIDRAFLATFTTSCSNAQT